MTPAPAQRPPGIATFEAEMNWLPSDELLLCTAGVGARQAGDRARMQPGTLLGRRPKHYERVVEIEDELPYLGTRRTAARRQERKAPV